MEAGEWRRGPVSVQTPALTRSQVNGKIKGHFDLDVGLRKKWVGSIPPALASAWPLTKGRHSWDFVPKHMCSLVLGERRRLLCWDPMNTVFIVSLF